MDGTGATTNMWSWSWRVVVILMILLHTLPTINACACNLRHPQQHVCEADFVVMARVRRATTVTDGLTAYKVRIKKVLKGNEKVTLALSKGLLYTVPDTCSIALKSRTTHVITGHVSGGKPWISICHFASPWKSLAPKMKKGFRLLYKTGCDCPIMSCHWWEKCPKANFFCAWETSKETEDCQARHGVCLRHPDGTCNWLGGRLYRTCMKKHKSQWKSSARVPWRSKSKDSKNTSSFGLSPRKSGPVLNNKDSFEPSPKKTNIKKNKESFYKYTRKLGVNDNNSSPGTPTTYERAQNSLIPEDRSFKKHKEPRRGSYPLFRRAKKYHKRPLKVKHPYRRSNIGYIRNTRNILDDTALV